jgi:hypothetical protein
MEKQQPPPKDRTEHKPIDPGRTASRENRTPGKAYEPRRSEPDSVQRRNDPDHDKR